MSDRYQQLINTPIGKVVSKQIGLPAPERLERYERGEPVISGPVLLGVEQGGRLTEPIANVFIGFDVVVNYRLLDVMMGSKSFARAAERWSVLEYVSK